MRKEQSKLASSLMMRFEGRLFMQEKMMGDDGGVQGLEKIKKWKNGMEHHSVNSVKANMERKWRSNHFGQQAYLV